MAVLGFELELELWLGLGPCFSVTVSDHSGSYSRPSVPACFACCLRVCLLLGTHLYTASSVLNGECSL